MDELSHLGWVAHRSYEFDGLLIGVRTNLRPFADWLDEVLADRLVKGVETDPNFSVLIGEQGKVGKRYHILYRESGALIRTLDLDVLGRAVLAELESVTFYKRRNVVYLHHGLVTRRGVTALIAPDLVPFLDEAPRRVAEAGVTLPLTAFTAIDLDSGEAIPIPHQVETPPGALEPLARIAQANGRVQTRTILDRAAKVDLVCGMTYVGEDPVRSISPGVGLFTLAATARNLPQMPRDGLRTLRRLVEGARCCQLLAQGRKPMLETLVSVLDDPDRAGT